VLRKVQDLLIQGRQVSSICEEFDLKRDTVNKAIRDGRLHRIENGKKKMGVV